MVKIVDNYTVKECIGKGQWGKVFRGSNIDTKMQVALKMIPLCRFNQVAKLSQLTRNQIETIKLLEDNINIIKFVEMLKTNRHLYLIYQYCEGGTLQDLIRSRGFLPERQALQLFRQLITAFKSLHHHCILHRDVKSSNIFFKSHHLKLADFGFCKQLKNPDDLTQTSLGSPIYMAPEVLNGDVYNSKADVWSCGIILYEMLFGHCPFGHCNISDLLKLSTNDKLQVEIPAGFQISPVVEGMLRRMLQQDQFRRISWEDYFYEYEISPQGLLTRKDKDFEYDLMKLMKKNSLPVPRTQLRPIKFDWNHITDLNSSVHSEELGFQQTEEETKLNAVHMLKRRIKQFQNQHTKVLELSGIIQGILQSGKQHHYSEAILYFLAHNLHQLARNNFRELNAFIEDQKLMLSHNPSENNCATKMLVVFANEDKMLSLKVGSIKVTLFNHQGIDRQVFKYPLKSILRKYLRLYIEGYEKQYPQITMLNNQGNRQECLLLLRVVWGLSLFSEDRKLNQLLNIKNQMNKLAISKVLSKYLVALGL